MSVGRCRGDLLAADSADCIEQLFAFGVGNVDVDRQADANTFLGVVISACVVQDFAFVPVAMHGRCGDSGHWIPRVFKSLVCASSTSWSRFALGGRLRLG